MIKGAPLTHCHCPGGSGPINFQRCMTCRKPCHPHILHRPVAVHFDSIRTWLDSHLLGVLPTDPPHSIPSGREWGRLRLQRIGAGAAMDSMVLCLFAYGNVAGITDRHAGRQNVIWKSFMESPRDMTRAICTLLHFHVAEQQQKKSLPPSRL